MKKFFAVGLVATIGAMALASAAALGGGTGLEGASLGANDAVVAACDTDGVTVGYTTSYSDGVGYVVDTVELSDLDGACDGLTAAVQLTSDGAGAAIAGADGSAAVAAGTASITLTTPPLAETVQDVHVVISD